MSCSSPVTTVPSSCSRRRSRRTTRSTPTLSRTRSRPWGTTRSAAWSTTSTRRPTTSASPASSARVSARPRGSRTARTGSRSSHRNPHKRPARWVPAAPRPSRDVGPQTTGQEPERDAQPPVELGRLKPFPPRRAIGGGVVDRPGLHAPDQVAVDAQHRSGEPRTRMVRHQAHDPAVHPDAPSNVPFQSITSRGGAPSPSFVDDLRHALNGRSGPGRQTTSESLREDRVCADGKPDDVALAGTHFGAIHEDGPSVSGPGDLKAARHPDDSFDAETGPELPGRKVLDKPADGRLEGGPLIIGQPAVFPPESVSRLVGGQNVGTTATPRSPRRCRNAGSVQWRSRRATDAADPAT